VPLLIFVLFPVPIWRSLWKSSPFAD
jgi:hypothetical protein